MNKALIKIVSTFFFVGYTPFISGTAASLAAAFLIWPLRSKPYLYILITVFVTALGFLFSSKAEKIFQRKDPKEIVIDEISGMFLSLLFLPVTVKTIVLAFILFRIFDAFKVPPAAGLQRLKGAKGIMLDDIVAALYTNLILQVVLRVF